MIACGYICSLRACEVYEYVLRSLRHVGCYGGGELDYFQEGPVSRSGLDATVGAFALVDLQCHLIINGQIPDRSCIRAPAAVAGAFLKELALNDGAANHELGLDVDRRGETHPAVD